MNSVPANGNFIEQLSAVWRRRWKLILGVLAIVTVPSISAVLALPDVYEADATVMPSADFIQPGNGVGTAGASEFESVTEHVLSRDRLSALIRQYGLYPNSRNDPQSAAGAMRKDILIEPLQAQQPGGNALPYAFKVIYRGGNPEKVAAIANSLAAAYQSVGREMQNRAFSNAADTLKSRLELVRKKLDGQQKLIDRYQAKHQGELPDQQAANLAAMQRLDSRLRDNDARQLRLMESRAELLREHGDSGQTSLQQMEQRLAELRLSYTDKYPEVVSLKQKITSLKAHQASGRTAAGKQTDVDPELSRVNSQIAALQREEMRLRSRINTYQQHLDDAPMAGQRLTSLTQGYRETSDLYASLIKDYEQARLAYATSGQGGLRFHVLEAAMVPSTVSGPGRLRLLVICLVLGLGLSGLAAMLSEQLDTSFHSLDELQAFTSLPVLAAVPAILTPGDKRKKRLRSGAAMLGILFLVVALGTGMSVYTHGNQALAQKFSHHIGSVK